MRELKLFSVVVAVVVMFMASFFYVKVVLKGPPKDVVPFLYVENEDDPGWDCRTMGNKVCGL